MASDSLVVSAGGGSASNLDAAVSAVEAQLDALDAAEGEGVDAMLSGVLGPLARAAKEVLR
jgi:hypothetical protein